jgi:predicted SAM-dependent methyltransferase
VKWTASIENFDMNVAFFIFNRPDTTKQVFQAIAAARPERLFVIADGARSDRPGELDAVEATKAIIGSVDWPCEVATNFSDQNLGCRQRVASGLKWVFEQVEEAIILEDDCLPHPSFFPYCMQLLQRYRHDDRVAAISGDNFQNGIPRTAASYYFSKYFHCWGWASWRRVFETIDFQMNTWPEFKAHGFLETWSDSQAEFDYWLELFDLQHAGEINSWAYPWFYSCWAQSGLTVLPNVNLVSNIGFDENATHTTESENKLANLPTSDIGQLQHPELVVRNRVADEYTFSHVFQRDEVFQKNDRNWRMFQSTKKFFRKLRGKPKFDSVAHRRSLIQEFAQQSPCRIVVGSSGIAQDGWLATEMQDVDLLDPESWARFFADDSIDAILAEHVWEHLTEDQGVVAAATCCRFLKPGGYLRLAVPDGNHPDADYIDRVKPGGSGAGALDHKLLYDIQKLTEVLTQGGLDVRPLEFFDSENKFQAVDWDAEDGLIRRSKRFDPRNKNGDLVYTSIVVDAFKR